MRGKRPVGVGKHCRGVRSNQSTELEFQKLGIVLGSKMIGKTAGNDRGNFRQKFTRCVVAYQMRACMAGWLAGWLAGCVGGWVGGWVGGFVWVDGGLCLSVACPSVTDKSPGDSWRKEEHSSFDSAVL